MSIFEIALLTGNIFVLLMPLIGTAVIKEESEQDISPDIFTLRVFLWAALALSVYGWVI